MPPNWWTAGGCVTGCCPTIVGRGKAVSTAGGARRLCGAQAAEDTIKTAVRVPALIGCMEE